MFWMLESMLEWYFIVNSFRLHISKPKKIPGNIFCWYFEGQKVVPQGAFERIQLYFEPDKRPAGAFWADTIAFWARKASRRGLLGKIFDKLRVRGRTQIFEKTVPEGFKSRFDRLER